jgi:diaminopimelate epimerase
MGGASLDRQVQMQENEVFFQNLPDYLLHFEGAGNQLGVVPMTLAGYDGDSESWKQDPKLRGVLTNWGKKINADSVMVLFGDPRKAAEQIADGQSYDVKMFVFEPSGDDGSGLGGGISTMCGNGIRAVAAWEREINPQQTRFNILSMSGLRVVDYADGMYTVRMGEFTNLASDLRSYVTGDKVVTNKDGMYIDSPIPEAILEKLSKYTKAKTWSIGLNGTRDSQGKIDGEPHVVIEIPEAETANLSDLRALAVKAGPLITKDLALFPFEICVNFIVVKGRNESGEFEILNCTHERNLGDDPNHSVTAACGTGSTVAGGFILEKYASNPSQNILVRNVGGTLVISRDKESSNSLLMKGPANRSEQK